MMILGYRSDVRIATSKKGFNILNNYVEERMKELNKKDYNLLNYLDINKENKGVCYFGWDSIKWYDGCEGYEDVDAILEGLDKLEEKDISYHFARIGENYDDYDEFNYDGDDEEGLETYVPYPSMTRYFDDEDIAVQMEITKEPELEETI